MPPIWLPLLALLLRKEPKRPIKADRITPADPSGNSRLGEIGILSLSRRMED